MAGNKMSDRRTSSLSPWLIVIPARLGSTRLKNKPLQHIDGVELFVRTAQNLRPLEKRGARLVVAADDEQILTVCEKYGIEGVQTRATHESGSDRVWEVAQRPDFRADWPFILNVQCDEPFLAPNDIIRMCQALEARAECDIATLGYANARVEDFVNPNVVKAVTRS